MTCLPSNCAMAFCSPSRTRRWKYRPWAFRSSSWSCRNESCGRSAMAPDYLPGRAVGAKDDFARQAALQQGEGLSKAVERHALVKKRLEIEPAFLEQRRHLHPSLEHAASENAVHRDALGDHATDQVQGDRLGRNAQQRGAASGAND